MHIVITMSYTMKNAVPRINVGMANGKKSAVVNTSRTRTRQSISMESRQEIFSSHAYIAGSRSKYIFRIGYSAANIMYSSAYSFEGSRRSASTDVTAA